MCFMMDNPGFWALLAVILAPGGVGFLWLVKRARLSPDAAEAVARPEGPLPSNHNEALISLAAQLDELRSDLTDHKIYVPQLIGWGRRGWQYAPAENREALPEPPKGIAI